MEKELYAQLLEDEAQLRVLCQEAFDSIDVPKTGKLDKLKLKAIMMEIAATYHTEMPFDQDISRLLSLTSATQQALTFEEFLEVIRKLIHTFLASQ